MFNNVQLQHHTVGVFHFKSLEYSVLSDEFKFERLCENEMRWCLYTVYQLSMLISNYENENLTCSVKLIFLYGV